MNKFLSLLMMLLWQLPGMSQGNVINITSAYELYALASAVNNGESYQGTNIVLNADIVLNENEEWIPIGTTYAPFQGTFDGQGHCISNLYVNADGQMTDNVAGLFGCIGEQGIVRRVGVESGIIRVANKSNEYVNCYVGGIAGLCAGHIEQCANSATVLGNQTMAFVGGIAGALGKIAGGATNASIEDCYNLGRIFTSRTAYNEQNYLAGIVGICDGAIRRVYVSTDVEISHATQDNRIANLSIEASPLENAYYTGDMTGFTLDGSLNTQGDYSVWSFSDGKLPQLTAFLQSTSVPGDLDGDAQVTLLDLEMLVNILVGKADKIPAADVNSDGEVSLADLTLLVNLLPANL